MKTKGIIRLPSINQNIFRAISSDTLIPNSYGRSAPTAVGERNQVRSMQLDVKHVKAKRAKWINNTGRWFWYRKY